MTDHNNTADADASTILLDPSAASQFLSKFGIRAAIPTLAKLRCIGGGPAFRRYGRRIVYERLELIRWAEERLSPTHLSTSDIGPAGSAVNIAQSSQTFTNLKEAV